MARRSNCCIPVPQYVYYAKEIARIDFAMH